MIAVVNYLYFIYVLNNHTVSHTAASGDDALPASLVSDMFKNVSTVRL